MKLLRHFWNFFVPHKGNDHKPHLFREEGIAFLLVVIMIATAFSFSGKLAVQTKFLTASVQSLLLADLANENRLDNNLPELVWNDTLARAAQLKADDMAAKGYFAHTSPDGVTPWYWFTQAGYFFTNAGENLAVNYTESVDVDEAWMDSPTHRANILNGNFTEVGVATATGEYKGKETTFVVQLFANPLVQLPQALPTQVTDPVIAVVTEETTQTPEVLGEETSLEENIKTIFVTDTYIAVENTTAGVGPEARDTQSVAVLGAEVVSTDTVSREVKVSTFARLLDNSTRYAVVVYRILFTLVVVSLVLMIGIEYKKQHKKNIAYGLAALLLLYVLIFAQTSLLGTAVSVL